MNTNIEPTTILKENEKFKLEDKDFLLVTTLQELNQSIKQLTAVIRR